MAKVVVTEKALRELVREAMWNKEFAGWSANSEGPAAVNAEVDPSAAVTDPVNPNFTPQNKTEFGIAVNQLVKNLPDTELPELFDTVKTAIDQNEEQKDEEEMTKQAAQGGTTQVEEAVRKQIRKVLAEMNPRWGNISEAKPVDWSSLPPVTNPNNVVPRRIPAGEHGAEYQRRIEKNKADLRKGLGKAVDTIDSAIRPEELGIEEPPVVDLGDEAPASTAPASGETPVNPEDPTVGDGVPDAPGKRKAYKSSALGGMSDVGGASFEKIAQELEFSVAGAKQAVDKAFEKAKFLFQDMDEDDREILILTAMNDYIGYLVKSGELTSADVQLMKDHPDIVRELDGFREFLHNHIRRARKAGQRVIDPVRDEDGAGGDQLPTAVGESVNRRKLAQRPVLRLHKR